MLGREVADDDEDEEDDDYEIDEDYNKDLFKDDIEELERMENE